jgi:transaldolase/glucose-6-phosphate isomerase
VPAAANPALVLGSILGVLATRGIDKLTLIASPGIHDLGAWLEQLVAESTGKAGKGIIPVDREHLGSPHVYRDDRLFVYLRLDEAADEAQDRGVAALEQAGRPVVRIGVGTKADLAAEFVRWELATAVAGAILAINPFDQPDVEASKVATRALTSEYEKTGSLPREAPFFEADGVSLFTDPANVAALEGGRGSERSLAGYIGAHLDRLANFDYLALLAYVAMERTNEDALQQMRHRARDARRVATCLGFGPRFLHSTGQAYKGGPNSGVFLQITADDAADLPVPGAQYSFGVVKSAQARGDFQVLCERGRRCLRVHVHGDVKQGLVRLREAVRRALAQPQTARR